MKIVKGVLVALIAMVAALAAPVQASIVTMDATSVEGDIAHVVFTVDDSSHGIMSVTGSIDVAGPTGILAILGLVPLSEYGDRFYYDNKWDPADTGPTGFNNGGMAFFLGDMLTKANFYDDTPGFIFSMNPGGDGAAYIPGHVMNSVRFNVVPEPASIALFGLGIAGIMLSGRRKTGVERQTNFGQLAA